MERKKHREDKVKGERRGGAGTPDPRGPGSVGRGKPAWRAGRKAVAVALGLQKGKWLIVRQADKLKRESANRHSVTLSIFLEQL